MRQRITLITLGVQDLHRALAFYRALGLQSDGIVGESDAEGGVVFFKLENLRLALWERTSIAKDTGLPLGPGSPTDFTLAHNVDTKEEVDRVMEEAQKAGATILKPAADAFWGGYTGYFQDPDGHIWEIAWNPEWNADDGIA
jgi:uncharacterized glyoxalase superfamily protein PhnB